MDIIIPLIAYVVGLGLLYVIIETAVTSALRRARREALTEQYAPERATWFPEDQRRFLQALADTEGRKPPVARG